MGFADISGIIRHTPFLYGKVAYRDSLLGDAAFRNNQRFFRVHIFPFKINDGNLKSHNRAEWFLFWENLKEGYDFFEKNGHIPPNTKVIKGRYVFSRQ